MKRHHYTSLLACGLLAITNAAGAACPDHFSPAAKERLADSIDIVPSAHQLNVVYFIGNDAEPVADYERRLSELLLYLQQFYGREMDRNGYGKRSFGLAMKENGNVDILLIRGKEPTEAYTYSGETASKCMDEINAWFNAHPGTKRSRHTFIVMPTHYNQTCNDKNPGGVPFFGWGTNCFALDYADFDIKHLGKDTPEGRLLTKWYGGFAHELGHGLNLPHNNGPASMNAALGTPLLNAGNYTFGTSPTYLTPASSAILDRSETFAPEGDATDFYSANGPVPQVRDLKVEYDGEALNISFRCLGDCAHVNAYIQDPPYAINQDYDAVSFTGTMKEIQPGEYEVTFTIPREELKSLRSDVQQLDFLFIEKNGCRCRWNTEIKWSEIQKGVLNLPVNFDATRSGY